MKTKYIALMTLVFVCLVFILPAQKSQVLTDHNGVPLDASITDPKISEQQRAEMIKAAQTPEPAKTKYDPLLDDGSLHDPKLSQKEREEMMKALLTPEPSKTAFDPLRDDPALTDMRLPHNQQQAVQEKPEIVGVSKKERTGYEILNKQPPGEVYKGPGSKRVLSGAPQAEGEKYTGPESERIREGSSEQAAGETPEKK